MAGILQALILRPHSHGNGVSRRPNLHIPTTQLRFSGHSLLPQQSLSIPLTLRASRKGSDQVFSPAFRSFLNNPSSCIFFGGI
ncbi:hypothetical protein ACLOJK_031328 [Asimina triloba]